MPTSIRSMVKSNGMLCDGVSHYYLEFFVNHGTKSNEDKTGIWKYGLGYTVVIRILKMRNYCPKKIKNSMW
jgi:hypothetical protein